MGTYVHAKDDRMLISGWPTDVVSIDHYDHISPMNDKINKDPEQINSPRNQRCSHESPCVVSSKKLCAPHTLILFIPGNPGVVHWYTDSLSKMIEKLGKGFALRGLSYAGHGVGKDVIGTTDEHMQGLENNVLSSKRYGNAINDRNINDHQLGTQIHSRDLRIPWTMDGQTKHKLLWIDQILNDWNKHFAQHLPHQSSGNAHLPKLVFLSHSIGAHFVQCLLLLRPDILARTLHVIHLMPFFRFDPPPLKKQILSTSARSYSIAIPIMVLLVRFLSILPQNWIDSYLKKIAGITCTKGRKIALDVFTDPNMIRNHLALGLQEIRDLPELPNDIALRLIGEFCSTSLLFCGFPDQWAPLFHLEDLLRMQRDSDLPTNIDTTYMEELRHDYVVHPEMVGPVVSFCVDRIRNHIGNPDDGPPVNTNAPTIIFSKSKL